MHERTQGRGRGAVAGPGSGEAVFEAGRTETRGGEFERWSGHAKEEDEGGTKGKMIRTPCPYL